MNKTILYSLAVGLSTAALVAQAEQKPAPLAKLYQLEIRGNSG